MKIKYLLIASFIFCTSARAQEIKTREQDLADEVGRIDLESGITNEQARKIAQYYCDRYISDCGSTSSAVDENRLWKIRPLTGVAGRPRGMITIDKHVGIISSSEGPELNLDRILDCNEKAPELINKSNKKIRYPIAVNPSTVKIQFVVLPSGTTTGFSFIRSSSSLKCDMEARRVVDGWKFARREQPITLVTSLKTCSR